MASQSADWILENCHDFYGILSVDRTATESAIRRSYYQLALKLHPDKCGEDTNAAEAFRLVNQAYGVLSNAKKRNMYDILGSKALKENPSVFEEEISFADGIATLFAAITYLLVRMVARRTIQEEWISAVMRRLFGDRFDKSDSDAAEDGSSAAFPYPHNNACSTKESARRRRCQTRRLGRRIFVVAGVLFCLAACVTSRVCSLSETQSHYAWRAAASSPLVADDAMRRTTQVLLREAHSYFARAKPFTFPLDCRHQTMSKSSRTLPPGTRDDRSDEGVGAKNDAFDSILVVRFGGSEADGRAAFRAYLDETCGYEMLLSDASRGRQRGADESIDNGSATRLVAHAADALSPSVPSSSLLQDDAACQGKGDNLPVSASDGCQASDLNDRDAAPGTTGRHRCITSQQQQQQQQQQGGDESVRMKRRYPVKNWRPRYKPVYTVHGENERFTVSDLCARYMQSSC